MKTEDFDFDVPEHLIAQKPADKRSDARMLVYYRESGTIIDDRIMNITNYIGAEYHLVFNNSKVIPSRLLITKKDTERDGEFLVLKIIDEYSLLVITDKNKKYKVGTPVLLPDGSECHVAEEIDAIKRKIVTEKPIFTIEYFTRYGLIPLPPYIRKTPDELDRERYQTTFGVNYGSAAAPTAGLHFDERLFRELDAHHVGYSYISLHVGLGTFQPIYTDTIEQHAIHEEEYEISPEEADILNNALLSGKKILPVGTTSLRTLESASLEGVIQSGRRSTRLYITPGYTLRVASGLFTNFHTPKSSLSVLVAALVGYDNFKRIYQHAIDSEYRLFSYGDCMLIL